jgi:hypothetical protein
MYDDGGVSAETKENARIPAEVSHAGTNAAMPSSGMIRCSSGFQRHEHRQRERPARVQRARRDRRRDGGAGGHVRDGLEEHFAQADSVTAQAGR